MTTESSNCDLAPIIADLQCRLKNYEDLCQNSEKADEDSKNGEILWDKCENFINEYEVAEDKVSLWC